MSLRNMAIHGSITTPAVLGGTAINLVGSPVQIPNGIQLVDGSAENYALRKVCTIKTRPPVYDSKTKKWSKIKTTMSFTYPELGADGEVVFNTLRIEKEVSPLAAAGVTTALKAFGISALASTDAASFWDLGTTD